MCRDDAFVIDDRDKTTRRLQVKTARCTGTPPVGKFTLSREQLRTEQPIELLYMFMLRTQQRWRFLIIPRRELAEIRAGFVDTERAGRGRRPKGDAAASSDSLALTLELGQTGARGWGGDLSPYLDAWPKELGLVSDGPGSRGSKGRAPTIEEDPLPSPDPET